MAFFFQLTVAIPSEQMDKICVDWCRKRCLHGALGGPVGREFGSPECEYNNQAQFPDLTDDKEDPDWAELAKEKENQPEVDVNLEYDNIFEAVTEDKQEAEHFKEMSDEMIKQRDAAELRGLFKTAFPIRKGAVKSILSHIKANQNIEDEASLQFAIEQALIANRLIEDDENLLESAWRFESKLEIGVYAAGVDENGKWHVVGKATNGENLITGLTPLSTKIVERLIKQNRLIHDSSSTIYNKVKLTMYRWQK